MASLQRISLKPFVKAIYSKTDDIPALLGSNLWLAWWALDHVEIEIERVKNKEGRRVSKDYGYGGRFVL